MGGLTAVFRWPEEGAHFLLLQWSNCRNLASYEGHGHPRQMLAHAISSYTLPVILVMQQVFHINERFIFT